jgi:hypothetical protein
VVVDIFIFIFRQPVLGARAAWVRTGEVGTGIMAPAELLLMEVEEEGTGLSPAEKALASPL